MLRPVFFRALVVLLVLPTTLPAAPDTVTLPLAIHQISGKRDGNAEYKLGIWLRLGGGARKLYEFDTGASGLFAAKSGAWWPHFSKVNHAPITQTYSSGNVYNAHLVDTRVDLGHGIPVVRAHVAQIDTASGSNLTNWAADVAAGRPPLYGHFYGDFGIDLNSGKGLSGLLPQLPGNLSSGFIVSTGGYQKPKPLLTIGLTDSLREQFPILLRMQRAKGFFPSSSGERRRHYQQELVNALVELSTDSQTMKLPVGVVLDTGAPSTMLHDLDNAFGLPSEWVKEKQVLDGVSFSMSHRGARGSQPWKMNFTTGSVAGLDAVGVTEKVIPPHEQAYANAGLVPFFRYEVMFDVESGMVGFRPIRKGAPRLVIAGQPAYSVGDAQTAVSGSATPRTYLVDHVEVQVGAGPFQRANGVTAWSLPVTLASGANVVTVRAVDISGQAATQTVTITAP